MCWHVHGMTLGMLSLRKTQCDAHEVVQSGVAALTLSGKQLQACRCGTGWVILKLEL